MGFYSCPDGVNKQKSWDLLNSLGETKGMPWMVFGDFNQVLGQVEKNGGNPITYSQVQGFQEAIQTNKLLDLGFAGHDFTWTNGQAGESNIQKRLDKALATINWKDVFPKAVIHHLRYYKSNHCPLLVDILREEGE